MISNNLPLALLVAPNLRSKVYLKEFYKKKIFFDKYIFLGKKDKFFRFNFKKIKRKNVLNINSASINDDKVYNKLKSLNRHNIIYSGYSGEIIKKKILKLNHIFLHAHSGDLPKYKGSTTAYYSLINNGNICVSIILMNKNIDQGKILFKKKFISFNKKIKKVSRFEIFARVKTLIEYISLKKDIKYIKNNNTILTNYYIAHPVIRYFGQKIYEKKNSFKSR